MSSCIQVFVTRRRMRRHLGENTPGRLGLAAFFGAVSSSCSFAAIATSRALFRKGATFINSLTFLLASTNLVIELGVVIAVFLSWHFVVGEYLGGVLLILITAAVVRLTHPTRWLEEARARGEDHDHHPDDEDPPPILDRIRQLDAWRAVGRAFVGEWQMVWKDVLIGFTVAGLIRAFLPGEAFAWIFPGAGAGAVAWWEVGIQSLVAPLAAAFTFIGSMGNIPLAAVLHSEGVSYAGVMAFIFSDLVVVPAVRIQARYHGWKVAAYIAGVFLIAIVASALLLHGGFALTGLLPTGAAETPDPGSAFALDTTLVMNVLGVGVTVALGVLAWTGSGGGHDHDHGGGGIIEQVLTWLAPVAAVWLIGGLVVGWVG